ncbi:MAG: hypothetical protein AVDCRST_MAG56-5087 [uncultured Cytophagales bacterium]|uniref:Uncharacterized protein n=1 Tax=uncultured Cytophagales bacterium TaxID=158755 RepID=A0A6J4K5M5_9SPHI|nr:MAG: hypothetical protein AVDCRST_MAG56-5087 [uncultured Cytophagales bacterium]
MPGNPVIQRLIRPKPSVKYFFLCRRAAPPRHAYFCRQKVQRQ